LAKRGAVSLATVAAVVLVITVGMHFIEGMTYLDAFYFAAMLSTGQGPNYTPATVAGKVFAAIMAFVAIGIVISALIFVFGPFFGYLLRMGWEKVEEEAERVEGRK